MIFLLMLLYLTQVYEMKVSKLVNLNINKVLTLRVFLHALKVKVTLIVPLHFTQPLGEW